jgi:tRNA A-37 threonylcarbamoyl transferase component Bud32
MDDDLLRLAGEALSANTGYSIRLHSPTEQVSDNNVVRCEAVPALPDGEESVIVKRVTSLVFNQPDSSGESQRFLNEWASLEFLDKLSAEPGYGPRLLGSDRSHSLLVLEDLGQNRSVEDVLLDVDREPARKALGDVGGLLGRMQSAAFGREEEFVAAQSRLGTESPRSDSTADQRTFIQTFQQCLDALSIEPAPGFWDSLHQVETLIHDSGLFRTFIHADAGPHNFLITNQDVRLLDFEFGAFRHGMSDVVGARLGFPQTEHAHSVPERDARHLEHAYRQEMVTVIPEAADDAIFNEALAAASAHWALNRWAGLWRIYFETAMREPESLASSESNENGRLTRASAFTIYQAFIDTAQTLEVFQPIAETLHAYTLALEQRWPELDVVPVYPSLNH